MRSVRRDQAMLCVEMRCFSKHHSAVSFTLVFPLPDNTSAISNHIKHAPKLAEGKRTISISEITSFDNINVLTVAFVSNFRSATALHLNHPYRRQLSLGRKKNTSEMKEVWKSHMLRCIPLTASAIVVEILLESIMQSLYFVLVNFV